MKITDVQICRVTLPTDRWLLVCVETDEGHRGWGEVTGSMDDHGLAALLEGLKPPPELKPPPPPPELPPLQPPPPPPVLI